MVFQKENEERAASVGSLATANLMQKFVEKAAQVLRKAEVLHLQRQNLMF